MYRLYAGKLLYGTFATEWRVPFHQAHQQFQKVACSKLMYIYKPGYDRSKLFFQLIDSCVDNLKDNYAVKLKFFEKV
jgi:hypothetical protein